MVRPDRRQQPIRQFLEAAGRAGDHQLLSQMGATAGLAGFTAAAAAGVVLGLMLLTTQALGATAHPAL
jgi:ABC-type nitrate/sulfonate/bicarbonate transport system permease component